MGLFCSHRIEQENTPFEALIFATYKMDSSRTRAATLRNRRGENEQSAIDAWENAEPLLCMLEGLGQGYFWRNSVKGLELRAAAYCGTMLELRSSSSQRTKTRIPMKAARVVETWTGPRKPSNSMASRLHYIASLGIRTSGKYISE